MASCTLKYIADNVVPNGQDIAQKAHDKVLDIISNNPTFFKKESVKGNFIHLKDLKTFSMFSEDVARKYGVKLSLKSALDKNERRVKIDASKSFLMDNHNNLPRFLDNQLGQSFNDFISKIVEGKVKYYDKENKNRVLDNLDVLNTALGTLQTNDSNVINLLNSDKPADTIISDLITYKGNLLLENNLNIGELKEHILEARSVLIDLKQDLDIDINDLISDNVKDVWKVLSNDAMLENLAKELNEKFNDVVNFKDSSIRLGFKKAFAVKIGKLYELIKKIYSLVLNSSRLIIPANYITKVSAINENFTKLDAPKKVSNKKITDILKVIATSKSKNDIKLNVKYSTEGFEKYFDSLSYNQKILLNTLLSRLEEAAPNFQINFIDRLFKSGDVALTDFRDSVIQISEFANFEDITEEIFHVLFEFLDDKTQQRLLASVDNHKIYKEVLEIYGDDERYDDNKLRREAVAKILTQISANISLEKFLPKDISSADKSKIESAVTKSFSVLKEKMSKVYSEDFYDIVEGIMFDTAPLVERLDSHLEELGVLASKKVVTNDFLGIIGDNLRNRNLIFDLRDYSLTVPTEDNSYKSEFYEVFELLEAYFQAENYTRLNQIKFYFDINDFNVLLDKFNAMASVYGITLSSPLTSDSNIQDVKNALNVMTAQFNQKALDLVKEETLAIQEAKNTFEPYMARDGFFEEKQGVASIINNLVQLHLDLKTIEKSYDSLRKIKQLEEKTGINFIENDISVYDLVSAEKNRIYTIKGIKYTLNQDGEFEPYYADKTDIEEIKYIMSLPKITGKHILASNNTTNIQRNRLDELTTEETLEQSAIKFFEKNISNSQLVNLQSILSSLLTRYTRALKDLGLINSSSTDSLVIETKYLNLLRLVEGGTTVQNSVNILIQSIQDFDNFFKQIRTQDNKIKNLNLEQLSSVAESVRAWENYISNIKKMLQDEINDNKKRIEEAKAASLTPEVLEEYTKLVAFLNSFSDSVESAKQYLDVQTRDKLTDSVFENFTAFNQSMESEIEQIEREISAVTDPLEKELLEKKLETAKKQFEENKVTRDKIENDFTQKQFSDIQEGTSVLNIQRYFDRYLTNVRRANDPVLASFGMLMDDIYFSANMDLNRNIDAFKRISSLIANAGGELEVGKQITTDVFRHLYNTVTYRKEVNGEMKTYEQIEISEPIPIKEFVNEYGDENSYIVPDYIPGDISNPINKVKKYPKTYGGLKAEIFNLIREDAEMNQVRIKELKDIKYKFEKKYFYSDKTEEFINAKEEIMRSMAVKYGIDYNDIERYLEEKESQLRLAENALELKYSQLRNLSVSAADRKQYLEVVNEISKLKHDIYNIFSNKVVIPSALMSPKIPEAAQEGLRLFKEKRESFYNKNLDLNLVFRDFKILINTLSNVDFKNQLNNALYSNYEKHKTDSEPLLFRNESDLLLQLKDLHIQLMTRNRSSEEETVLRFLNETINYKPNDEFYKERNKAYSEMDKLSILLKQKDYEELYKLNIAAQDTKIGDVSIKQGQYYVVYGGKVYLIDKNEDGNFQLENRFGEELLVLTPAQYEIAVQMRGITNTDKVLIIENIAGNDYLVAYKGGKRLKKADAQESISDLWTKILSISKRYRDKYGYLNIYDEEVLTEIASLEQKLNNFRRDIFLDIGLSEGNQLDLTPQEIEKIKSIQFQLSKNLDDLQYDITTPNYYDTLANKLNENDAVSIPEFKKLLSKIKDVQLFDKAIKEFFKDNSKLLELSSLRSFFEDPSVTLSDFKNSLENLKNLENRNVGKLNKKIFSLYGDLITEYKNSLLELENSLSTATDEFEQGRLEIKISNLKKKIDKINLKIGNSLEFSFSEEELLTVDVFESSDKSGLKDSLKQLEEFKKKAESTEAGKPVIIYENSGSSSEINFNQKEIEKFFNEFKYITESDFEILKTLYQLNVVKYSVKKVSGVPSITTSVIPAYSFRRILPKDNSHFDMGFNPKYYEKTLKPEFLTEEIDPRTGKSRKNHLNRWRLKQPLINYPELYKTADSPDELQATFEGQEAPTDADGNILQFNLPDTSNYKVISKYASLRADLKEIQDKWVEKVFIEEQRAANYPQLTKISENSLLGYRVPFMETTYKEMGTLDFLKTVAKEFALQTQRNPFEKEAYRRKQDNIIESLEDVERKSAELSAATTLSDEEKADELAKLKEKEEEIKKMADMNPIQRLWYRLKKFIVAAYNRKQVIFTFKSTDYIPVDYTAYTPSYKTSNKVFTSSIGYLSSFHKAKQTNKQLYQIDSLKFTLKNNNPFAKLGKEYQRLTVLEQTIGAEIYKNNIIEENPVTRFFKYLMKAAMLKSQTILSIDNVAKNTIAGLIQNFINSVEPVPGFGFTRVKRDFSTTGEGLKQAWKAYTDTDIEKEELITFLNRHLNPQGRSITELFQNKDRYNWKELVGNNKILTSGMKVGETVISFQMMFDYVSRLSLKDADGNDVAFLDSFEQDAEGQWKIKDGVFKTFQEKQADGSFKVSQVQFKMSDLKNIKRAIENGRFLTTGNSEHKGVIFNNTYVRNIFFFMNYLIPMFQGLFVTERKDFVNNTVIYNYNLQILRFIKNGIQYLFKRKNYWNYMTHAQKKSTLRAVLAYSHLYALWALIQFLFGFDPEEEDAYKKLKTRNNASNFALYVTLKAASEIEQTTLTNPLSKSFFPALTANFNALVNPTIARETSGLYGTVILGIQTLAYYLGLEDEDEVFFDEDDSQYGIEEGESKFIHKAQKYSPAFNYENAFNFALKTQIYQNLNNQ